MSRKRSIMTDPTSLPYRPAAAVMLLNPENKVWVGQRIDNIAEAWQMPQGGLDEGEEPTAAALRELEEETGIASHLVQIIAQSREEHLYDLPRISSASSGKVVIAANGNIGFSPASWVRTRMSASKPVTPNFARGNGWMHRIFRN